LPDYPNSFDLLFLLILEPISAKPIHASVATLFMLLKLKEGSPYLDKN